MFAKTMRFVWVFLKHSELVRVYLCSLVFKKRFIYHKPFQQRIDGGMRMCFLSIEMY